HTPRITYSAPLPQPPHATLSPYTTLFRSDRDLGGPGHALVAPDRAGRGAPVRLHRPLDEPHRVRAVHRVGHLRLGRRAAGPAARDRKSTRLNSSHQTISYDVLSLEKKQPD